MLLPLLMAMMLSAITCTVARSECDGGNDLSTRPSQATKDAEKYPRVERTASHYSLHCTPESKSLNPYQNSTKAQDTYADVIGSHNIEVHDLELRDLLKKDADHQATSTQGDYTVSKAHRYKQIKEEDALDIREIAVFRRDPKDECESASSEQSRHKQENEGAIRDKGVSEDTQSLQPRHLDTASHAKLEGQHPTKDCIGQRSSIRTRKLEDSIEDKAAQTLRRLVVRSAYPDPSAHPMRANSWLPQKSKDLWYPRPPSVLTSKGQPVPRRSRSKGYCTTKGEYRIKLDMHGLFNPRECHKCRCVEVSRGESTQPRLDNLPQPALNEILLKQAMLHGDKLRMEYSKTRLRTRQALHPRQPEPEPDAQPMRQNSLVPFGSKSSLHSKSSPLVTTKGDSIPKRSSKHTVKCNDGVNLNCWDMSKKGKGYCTTKGEYKLRAYMFWGLFSPSICIAECHCIEAAGQEAGHSDQIVQLANLQEDHPTRYMRITRKGGGTVHTEKLMQDLRDAMKEVTEEQEQQERLEKSQAKPALRPRQPRAEPEAGRLRQWIHSKFNKPQPRQGILKYGVDCPSGVSVLCKDLSQNALGTGWCTETAEYRFGSQVGSVPPRRCASCRCVERKGVIRTDSGKQNSIKGGDVEMQEMEKKVQRRHVESETKIQKATKAELEETNLYPRQAEPGFLQKLRGVTRVPFDSHNQELRFAHLGQSNKYVVQCPESVVFGCRDGSETAKGWGYCTDKAKFKLQSAMVTRKQCKGCKCVEKKTETSSSQSGTNSASQQIKSQHIGENEEKKKDPAHGHDSGLQLRPRSPESNPNASPMQPSGKDSPNRAYTARCPPGVPIECQDIGSKTLFQAGVHSGRPQAMCLEPHGAYYFFSYSVRKSRCAGCQCFHKETGEAGGPPVVASPPSSALSSSSSSWTNEFALVKTPHNNRARTKAAAGCLNFLCPGHHTPADDGMERRSIHPSTAFPPTFSPPSTASTFPSTLPPSPALTSPLTTRAIGAAENPDFEAHCPPNVPAECLDSRRTAFSELSPEKHGVPQATCADTGAYRLYAPWLDIARCAGCRCFHKRSGRPVGDAVRQKELRWGWGRGGRGRMMVEKGKVGRGGGEGEGLRPGLKSLGKLSEIGMQEELRVYAEKQAGDRVGKWVNKGEGKEKGTGKGTGKGKGKGKGKGRLGKCLGACMWPPAEGEMRQPSLSTSEASSRSDLSRRFAEEEESFLP
ncbi:hypothetical protein MMC10_004580 [Thelotrema lepadinum]|nr:hypothetical protein [Thelotrema lepadinum]